jgi:nucleoside-diphosphate-sugar epimerase
MILVTGGTGLVGSHLLYHLVNRGEKVKAIFRSGSDLQKVKKVFGYHTLDNEILFKKIDWIEADLNDIPELEKAFKNIKQVYHCAAMVSFDPKDYHKMRKINIEGTENIVNLSISNKIEKLCFVSSIASLSWSINEKKITESNFWTNSTNKSEYAITKHGAENEIWRASQEGVDVVIVNPGVILGSGFWGKGTGKIFDRIYHRFKFYTLGVTGFIGVKDVVNIMIELMHSDIKDERFILIAENSSFKDIFFKIADHFGVKRPSKNISSFLSEFGWKIAWFKSKFTKKSAELTKFSARAAHQKRYYSSEKIKKTLGYTFESMDQSITAICKDYLKDLT